MFWQHARICRSAPTGISFELAYWRNRTDCVGWVAKNLFLWSSCCCCCSSRVGWCISPTWDFIGFSPSPVRLLPYDVNDSARRRFRLNLGWAQSTLLSLFPRAVCLLLPNEDANLEYRKSTDRFLDGATSCPRVGATTSLFDRWRGGLGFMLSSGLITRPDIEWNVCSECVELLTE